MFKPADFLDTKMENGARDSILEFLFLIDGMAT